MENQEASSSWQRWNVLLSTHDHEDDIKLAKRVQGMQGTDSKIMNAHFSCLIGRVAQANSTNMRSIGTFLQASGRSTCCTAMRMRNELILLAL